MKRSGNRDIPANSKRSLYANAVFTLSNNDVNQLHREAMRDVERVVLILDVNGEARQLLVHSHKTLLEVLREDMQLTGTKHVCEVGAGETRTVLMHCK